MDVLLFVFAINVLRAEFHLSAAQAGLVSSFTLAFSAGGGIVFGVLFGPHRARARAHVGGADFQPCVGRYCAELEPRIAVILARADWYWFGRGMVHWRCAGGGNMAGGTSREGCWDDAIRLGAGIHAGCGDDRRDSAALGLASAFPRGLAACAAGNRDPPSSGRTGDLAEDCGSEDSRSRYFSGRIAAANDTCFRTGYVRSVRLLGIVYVDSLLPLCFARRAAAPD